MSGIANLDIKQLRVLHFLLIEHNVSKVAAQMGISQQAVSDQLKKLRHTFNDRLFVRKSNGLIPTPYALSLQNDVANIIAQVEKLVAPKDFDPSSTSGVFTICATDYAQSVILPNLLAKLRSQAPNLKVIVRDIEIDNLSQLLDSAEVDLVLSFPSFVPSKYPKHVLYTETHQCVISKTHPKAEHRWTMEEIASHPQLIISPKRANLVGSADTFFKSHGLKRNIVMTVPFFAAAAECIASTDVIALLPSKLLPNDNLKVLNCQLNLPTFDVITVWHQRSDQDPLNRWIRKQVNALYDPENKST
ncbi:LysR family transcriptional regulator [Pseudoalteromonas phenolica]|uniref:LysR family transcriptional regulator n=1 Tax=Pseudoalteromonas phenolica TaxID=161398 RepID=UPI0038504D83